MKVGPTEIKEDDSFDNRRKTSFQQFKKGAKGLDTYPVATVINKSKY